MTTTRHASFTLAGNKGGGDITIDGELYVTSDTHFGHGRIISLCGRPFTDATEMDEALVENWNRVVGPRDTVLHLGDFAMGTIAQTLPTVGRLNGTIHLIAGNHDRCWDGHRKTGDWPARYLDAGFASIHSYGSLRIDGRRSVELCHFPYAGDSHAEDRYREHRPADRGAWLLHGHVHDAWVVRGRQINVGVDAWNHQPVPLDTLVELIAGP